MLFTSSPYQGENELVSLADLQQHGLGTTDICLELGLEVPRFSKKQWRDFVR